MLCTTLRQTLTAGDGNEYSVTVTYDSASGIPADAKLYVSEIKEGDAGYDEYVEKTASALGQNPENLAFARPFDITLNNPQTGEKYQPNEAVQVSIQLLKDNLNNYANVDVVHIPDGAGENAQVMDTTVHGESVEFATDGFSVYVLAASNSTGSEAIDRQALTITANNETKVYTGTSLSLDPDAYTSTGLAAEDTIESVTLTGEQTYLGTCEIVPSAAVIKNRTTNEDVTANYDITYVNGSLTVTWPENMVDKELTAFNGNLATYTITVNPERYILADGQTYILKDTFSDNQSINYGSVNIETTGETVNYDFSGQTGTYVIPDGSTVTITYTTRVKGQVGEEVTLSNAAVVGSMEGAEFKAGPSATVTETKTISPTGTDISGTGGVYSIDLFAYADGHMERGLGGAEFRLLDQNMRPMHYLAGENSGNEIRFTTGEDGTVTIVLNSENDGLTIQKNTVYFLEMVTAPYEIVDGEYVYYQKDDTFYSFLITDEPSYEYGDIFSYFNGDVLKVRCYPEAEGINVTKRFGGNYTLTDEQKNAITFTLQKEAQYTASGWVDVESHTYADFSYGSINFSTGREGGTELEDFATYRIIEENALPEALADTIDENVSVTVSYQQSGKRVTENSNEFTVDPDEKLAFSYDFAFTNEYVDHKLTLIKINENTGAPLPGAIFSVYAADNTETPVAIYTTGEDGSITIRRSDEGADYAPGTLYYVVESKAPEGYVIPASPEKVYFYFSENGSGVPAGLPAGRTATDLTTSYNTVTLPNSSAKVSIPVAVVWGINSNEAWPDNVGKVVVDLYSSVDGEPAQQALGDDYQPLTLELTKDKYYDTATFVNLPTREDGKDVVYSVVVEGVFAPGGADITTQFAQSVSISGTGWHVVKNEPAVSVTVSKQWFEQGGTAQVADTSAKADVSFDLYRTTTQAEGNFNRAELVAFLADAEKVRTGLTLSKDSWSTTIDSLQSTDREGRPYYYYALENPIPDNQEDSYLVAPATDSDPRTLTIKNTQTPFTVTIAVNDIEKTYGDETPDYTFTADVKEEGATVEISGPDAQGNYSATVNSGSTNSEIKFTVSREEGENVGTYAITPTGDALQLGYRVLFETGTLTISPAEVTITAGASKVYGEDDPALVTVTGLKNNDTAGPGDSDTVKYTVSREEGEDVGDYPITLTGESDQGNYRVTYDRSNPVFTIARALATVTANPAAKQYGEDDPELTATVTGLQRGDEASVLNYDLTRGEGEDVGDYAITPAGEAEQGNYSVSYERAVFSITAANLTIKAVDAEKSYGDADPEWEVEIGGLYRDEEGGTLASVLDEATGARAYTYTLGEGDEAVKLLTFTITRDSGEDVGSYTVAPAGAETQGNYTVKFESGTLRIERAELIVTADHVVKAVGVETDPLLTATVTGWKNGDDPLEDTTLVSTQPDENGTVTRTYRRGSGAAEVTFRVISSVGADKTVTWTYKRGEDTLLTFTLNRDPGEEEGEYPITVSGEQNQSNYSVEYEQGSFGILSILDVDVKQPVIDYADTDAAPSYTYTAKLDLTGTGLVEYEKNGFTPVDGVPTCTFTLPDANKADTMTLKVPGGAKLTVEQTSTNDDYNTALSLDGNPYTDPNNRLLCILEHVDTYHEMAFTHSRISYPVEARVSETQFEEGAKKLEGRKGAMGIPTGDELTREINTDFADDMHSKIGYVLPTDKYYMYDHASLYTTAGAVEGASNVSAIKYDRENGKWQYKAGEGDFVDVPENTQLVLFYLPRFVCKVGTEKFYSLRSAVEYVQQNITEKTATIEMLIGDYTIRSSNDAVTIPEGYDITITTASTEYEGTGTAVISRSASYPEGHLFYNDGILTFDNIILDGKGVQATDALVLNRDNEPTLNINSGATLRNASGNNGGAIYVKKGVVTVNGTLSGNAANSGGAVYVNAGTFTLGGSITGGSATNGGAIYVNDGTVEINGTVSASTANSGGAVYLNKGSLNVTGSITGNSAESGGAVYQAGGTLTVSGSLTGNTASANGGALHQTGGTVTISGSATDNNATNGGALYMTNGTLNVTETGSLSSNSATVNGGAIYQAGSSTLNNTGTIGNNTAANGGALYLAAGTFNQKDGSLTGNTATANGGAIYGAGGTVKVSGGAMTGNAADGNGGAIYTANAAVSVSGGTLGGAADSGNTAANGGAIYADAGAVTVSGGALTGNAATGNGGAVYVDKGSVTYSGGSITQNSALNGSAIFVYSGSATVSTLLTGNTATLGGAIGVGTVSARLYFKGDAQVTGNTLKDADPDEPQRNVYLDVDSDQVINVSGDLNKPEGETRIIGVYVPGEVDSDQVVKHGDVSGTFGAYTNTKNVETVFINDRFEELDAKYENSRLYWGAPLTYDVVYKKAFDSTEPPTAGAQYNYTNNNNGTTYNQVALNKTFYPHGTNGNEYIINELVTSMDLYNTYTTAFNNRAGGATYGAAAVFAYAYANSRQNQFDDGLQFPDYLTKVEWDNVNRKWLFVKSDGDNAVVNTDDRRIVIIYSAPAYLTVTNNNGQDYALDLSALTVNVRTVADEHYGYVTARNGATVDSLVPLVSGDLVLADGESVKLLFPGVQGKNYTLSGTFGTWNDGVFVPAPDTTPVSYTINGGTPETNTGATVTISRNLKNDYSAEEIVFGEALPICKIGNKTFPTLKAAVQYMVDNTATLGTKYTVEMLVDYLIPASDVMVIPSGYQVTFTTSQDDDFRGAKKGDEAGRPNRAILSRDVGNSGSSMMLKGDENDGSTLYVSNLIFDGRAIAGTGNGGAISTKYCDVTIENCEFKGYRATRGGAIFVVRGGKDDQAGAKDADGVPLGGLKIYNSVFTNCKYFAQNGSPDKAGGGAVWTTAKGMVIKNCKFNDCACESGRAQGGSVFHNIVDNKQLVFSEFDGEPRAYYEAGYSLYTKCIIENTDFNECYAIGGAGGAVETDAEDTVITGSNFYNCYTNAAGGGGALIVYARDRAKHNDPVANNPPAWPDSVCTLTISYCRFVNSRAEGVTDNSWGGGAIRTTTSKTIIKDSTFEGAITSKNGAALVVTNDYATDLSIYRCTFKDCEAKGGNNGGGAVFYPGINLTVVDSTFTNCITEKAGGALNHSAGDDKKIQKKDETGTVVEERIVQRKSISSTTIHNIVCDSCTARTEMGGGLYTNTFKLTVSGDDTHFSNCTAQTHGGGVCHWMDTNGSSASFSGTYENCVSNTATGGAIRSAAKTVTMEHLSVSDCRAVTEGGGVWINGSPITINGCSFENNSLSGSASKGGGIYYGGGGTITYFDTVINNCSAVSGGGLYFNNGTITVYGSSAINGNATNGGGIYQVNGTINHYSGTVSGSASEKGGGVYKNNGTYTLNAGIVDDVSYSGASIGSVTMDEQGQISYTSTAGTDGGGIYQNNGTVNLYDGCSISGQADGNGGGGWFGNSTLNQYGGTIIGSATNGGGVYHTRKWIMNGGSVSGIASNNGGAIYYQGTGDSITVNEGIIGQSAIPGSENVVTSSATNGGGVYVAGGTYTFKKGSVVRNTAVGNGGGVYHGGGTFSMTNGGAIIGGVDNGNTANKGGGVFVADGQKPTFNDGASKTLEISYNHAQTEGGGIAVGGSGAVLTFQNAVKVRNNTMGATNAECNVYLDVDSNTVIKNNWLDPTSYIGVYVKDAQREGHGLPGTPFGTYSNDANLNVYHNDRTHYLTGTKGSNNLVKWAEFVCRITDGEGNLLYKDRNGTPAVYDTLENSGATGAFNVLNVTGTPALYTRDGTLYPDGEYQVQMLVSSYVLGSGRQINLGANTSRKVILTTAKTEDECGFKYNGDPRFNAVIIRDAATVSMIKATNSWELTLCDITLDGGGFNSTGNGGIVFLQNSASLSLDKGAVLQNSNTTQYDGAAVWLQDGNNKLTMNSESRIVDCKTNTGKGGGVAINNGTFTMNGGSITGCSASNGGGIYLNNSGKIFMNGGTITGNSATSTGGGISLNNGNSRITFSGHCTVTDNTLNGTTRCNVQLTQDSNAIINADGLDSRSEIGVYTASSNIRSKHGEASKPFGTRKMDDDKLFCFINDVYTNLRGYQSADINKKEIYWEYHPLLTVAKAVSSDLTADQNKEFTFTVKLPGTTLPTQSERSSITGMSFNSNGTATVTLKAGESATAIFPDSFDKLRYEVKEVLSGDAAVDYTVAAEKNGTDFTFSDDKPLTASGQLGENVGTENSTSLSEVVFTNTRATGDLTVSKQVVSDVESDKAESFDFKVTLNDEGISKTFETTKRDAENNETVGTLTFTAGVSDAFSLKDGESLTIKGLPTDLKYTVQEILKDAQKANIRTQVSKNGSEPVYAVEQDGTIGEKYTIETVNGAQKTVYASKVTFTNNFLEIVCKITNRSRALLYYRDAAGNLQPAIFAHLEDAFDQINSGNLRTSGNGTVSGQLRVEMVVPQYTMERTATLNSGKTVLLSTALPSDADYPYKGESDGDNISTVYRGFEEGSMIVDNGALTIDKIVLDGGSTLSEPAATAADGGIVRVAGRVRLTVNSAAKLQNSVTTGQGGAIWLVSGASLTMNGTISNCSAASGGGIYANTGFTTITSTGTITGCEATSGNGGAIYASTGTSVNLNAGTTLTGNAATENGGAVYTEANLILRGSVGGTGASEGNTADGNGGGIYMGEGTTFTMYAGSSISGNRANNGGGLATQSTARIAGGTLQDNIAQQIVTGEGDEQTSTGGHGGAVYAAGNAVVTISGAPVITWNEAAQGGAVYNGGAVTMTGGAMTGNIATDKGGAVYVAEAKTFTMSGGSIKDGNKSPEGAVSTDANATLAFSGNAVVSGNTDSDGTTAKNVYLGYDSNAIITSSGLGSGANIGVYVADGNPEPAGTPDRVDNPIYADHGVSGRDFGTYTGSNLSGARLNKFVNDRDTSLTGMSGTLSGGTQHIAWIGKGLELKVTQYLIQTDDDGNPVLDDDGNPVLSEEQVPVQNASFTFTRVTEGADDVQVWSGKSGTDGIVTIPWGGNETAGGNVASFVPGSVYRLDQTAAAGETVLPAGHWKVTIGRDNSVTWKVEQGVGNVDRTLNIALPEKAFLGETFGLKNDVKPTLTYNATGGKLSDNKPERQDTIAFTTKETSHAYTIKEVNPTWDSHVFKAWATMKEKPEVESTEQLTDEQLQQKLIEQGYFEYSREDRITFYRGTDSADPAEKYTQTTSKGDMTLYAQWDEVVCKITDRNGTLLYIDGSPAVYGTLEDGFKAYNEAGTYDFTYSSGGRATARRIEMLVGEYELSAGVTLNRGKTVMLTTAPSTDTDGYAYTGEDNTVCVITRGESYSGSMITNNSNLTLMNVTLDGDGHRNDRDEDRVIVCDGGIVKNAQASAVLTIAEGATLRNSFVEGNGGAVNAIAGTTVYLTGGTISGNSSGGTDGTENGNGAGIYLAKGSRLYLSGSPSFSNNVSDATLPDDAKNGGYNYTQARQDIYLAGVADEGQALTSITLTDNLPDSYPAGSIWVWAEGDDNTQPNHYYMLKQFAVVSFTKPVSEATCKAFRNARADVDTDCGADYLTGQEGDDIGALTCLYWTGGFDFVFRKIDSFGNPLDGAVFTLYRADAAGNAIATDNNGQRIAYQVSGPGGKTDAKAESRDIAADSAVTVKYTADGTTIFDRAVYGDGLVRFEKIPPGTYFLVETTKPNADPSDSSTAAPRYRTVEEMYRVVLDGKGCYTIRVAEKDGNTTRWVEVLKTTFSNDGSGKYTVSATQGAAGGMDVYNILNVSPYERKVILRKVKDGSYQALQDAQFTLYHIDMQTVVSVRHSGADGTEHVETLENLTAQSSGVFWIGQLPYGVYYLKETRNAEGENTQLWFVLTVNENGAGYRETDGTISNRLEQP